MTPAERIQEIIRETKLHDWDAILHGCMSPQPRNMIRRYADALELAMKQRDDIDPYWAKENDTAILKVLDPDSSEDVRDVRQVARQALENS